MAKWHQKHISTQWGIAIFGWLLVSVILLIPVLGQNQDFRSHASRPPEVHPTPTTASQVKRNVKPAVTCTALTSSGVYKKGRCQLTTRDKCTNGKKYYTGRCPGAANIKCCAPIK